MFMAAVAAGCEPEAEMVSLGVEETYSVYRMRTLKLHPEFTGSGGYEWSMPDSQGRDSVVSTARDFYFVGEKPGVYALKLRIIDSADPMEVSTLITVWEEEVAYSPYIRRVLEYRPAPGQFVNLMPKYEPGDTEADMVRKCTEAICDKNDNMVSLGNYGGYITFAFDHTVANVHGEPDFKIHGNAFYDAAVTTGKGGSAEPGIVMVSIDENQNGLPDDTWYELAGSEYRNPLTLHGYSITYTRPGQGHQPSPIPASPITDSKYIAYADNHGREGYVQKNSYHAQDYWPQWLNTSTLSFSGSCLPCNAIDESGDGSHFVLYPYEWGYADNHPNEIPGKADFNIDWAVDADGNPVALPGADFIRVYTGVNQQCGWLGETSTEICRAQDLHIN